MERLFTIGLTLGFLSHIDSITAYRQVFIADRLLPSRACFLLMP
ncbi:hypothetical protein [Dysgonomonas sp. GY75]|jgi:hypothetical protein|nr:hypothetical protein [Dysgonomonas sp. GY75]